MPRFLVAFGLPTFNSGIVSGDTFITGTFGMKNIAGGNVEMNQRLDHVELTRLQSRDPEVAAARVVSVDNLSPSIKGLTLKCDCEQSFKPGQWVDFFIPGIEKVGGFSMCSDPAKLANEKLIDLAVKYSTWPPAHWVHTKCSVGDEIAIRFGGDFHYPPATVLRNDHSIVLIAGGVGINPLFSIWLHSRHLTEIDSKNKPVKVCLLYSAATQDELIFRQGIDQTTKKLSNFTCQYFVTKGPNPTGRIPEAVLRSCVSSSVGETLYYLCGPPSMIQDISNNLMDIGVDKDKVIYENWW